MCVSIFRCDEEDDGDLSFFLAMIIYADGGYVYFLEIHDEVYKVGTLQMDSLRNQIVFGFAY